MRLFAGEIVGEETDLIFRTGFEGRSETDVDRELAAFTDGCHVRTVKGRRDGLSAKGDAFSGLGFIQCQYEGIVFFGHDFDAAAPVCYYAGVVLGFPAPVGASDDGVTLGEGFGEQGEGLACVVRTALADEGGGRQRGGVTL